jgi:Flp pilus assembly protein TadD
MSKWVLRLAVIVALCLIWALEAFGQNRPAENWQAEIKECIAKKNMAGALRIADARLQIAPGDFEALGWRARLLYWSGRGDEAEREYRAILGTYPNDTDVLLGLVDVVLSEQKSEEALQLLSRAQALLPPSAEIEVRRGRALRAMGRSSEARVAFRQALALEPANSEARAGLDSVAEGPRNELRVGMDIDKYNFTDHWRAVTLSLRSDLASRWTSNFSSTFYHRAGQDATRFSGALTFRMSRRDSLTAGFAAARDQGVIPKGEAFLEYGHGLSFNKKSFVRGMEVSYAQRWLWFDSPRILTFTPSALLYLPHDWTWQITVAVARSHFPTLPVGWRPSGSTRLSFPLHRRVQGNIFFANGTEDFARTDQLGRFSARTYGGGVRIALRQRQELSFYVAYQDRSQNRTQTSLGFSYAIRF